MRRRLGAKEGEKFGKAKGEATRAQRAKRRFVLRESDTWKETKGQGQQGRRTQAEASCPRPRRL